MDEQLKQRVVGAAVVVLLGVIFIPMLLRGPPASDGAGAEPRVALNPPVADDAFSSRIVPLAPSRGAPAAHEIAMQPSLVDEGSAPAAPAQLAAAPPSQPATPEAGFSPPLQGWAIQLGSFTNGSNALALRDRLKSQGYPAFVEVVEQGGQRITRVLIGPERERSSAQAALEALREVTKLQGIVVGYPNR